MPKRKGAPALVNPRAAKRARSDAGIMALGAMDDDDDLGMYGGGGGDEGSDEEAEDAGDAGDDDDDRFDTPIEDDEPAADDDEGDDEEDEEEADDGQQDGEEMDGIDGDDVAGPSERHLVMAREKAGKGLYKLPTSQEVMELRETTDLFKSNLFRMQITELLNEVKVDYQKTTVVESALHELHAVMAAAPSLEVEATENGKYPGVPFCGVGAVKLKFAAPERIDVVGSFLLRTTARPNLNVDVAVQMPASCFHAKDFMNYRYHNKRHLYLQLLARHIRKTARFANVTFAPLRSDSADKPVLIIRPGPDASGKKSRFILRVLPCIDPALFPAHKLAPTRNNVRREAAGGAEAQQVPTPFYNATVLEDALLRASLQSMHEQLAAAGAAAVETVMIFKVWLRQRGFDNGPDGFNGFLATMLITHLLETRAINYHMSSYQMLRLALEFIASTNWTQEGVFMRRREDSEFPGIDAPPHGSFQLAFDVVFVDASGHLNLAARMTRGAYDDLRHEAMLAVAYLGHPSVDHFEPLLMKKVSFLDKFDAYITVEAPTVISPDTDGARDMGIQSNWEAEVARTLQRALGPRVTLMRMQVARVDEWPVDKKVPTASRRLLIGFCVNTATVGKQVDMGPPATNKDEAREFREFWGDKAEMRRFKDGALNEVVVWDQSQRRFGIVLAVAQYILAHHKLVERQDAVALLGAELEDTINACTPNSGLDVMLAFDTLAEHMRNLTGFPLHVRQVEAVGAAARDMAVDAPAPHVFAGAGGDNAGRGLPHIAPVDVVLQFESSGAWPDDLEAITHVKTAFYIELAERLTEQFGHRCMVTADFVDVCHAGYAFRVVIYHDREIHLMKEAKHPRATLLEALLVHRVAHAAAIHGLAARFPAFTPAVRIFKRWLAAHMFSRQLGEEAAELLLAFVFACPRPYEAPNAPLTAFMRVLHMLSSTDFNSTPLVLDMLGDATAEQLSAIQSEFTAARARPVSPALFLATPEHPAGAPWLVDALDLPVLGRLVALAQSSYATLQAWLLGTDAEALDWETVFRTPLEHFNVVAPVDRQAIARAYGWKGVSKFKNLQSGVGELLIGFDPLTALADELDDRFGHVALFFGNPLLSGPGAGPTLAAAWRAPSWEEQELKLGRAAGMAVAADGGAGVLAGKKKRRKQGEVERVQPSAEEIVADIRRMGAGLIIDVNQPMQLA